MLKLYCLIVIFNCVLDHTFFKYQYIRSNNTVSQAVSISTRHYEIQCLPSRSEIPRPAFEAVNRPPSGCLLTTLVLVDIPRPKPSRPASTDLYAAISFSRVWILSLALLSRCLVVANSYHPMFCQFRFKIMKE